MAQFVEECDAVEGLSPVLPRQDVVQLLFAAFEQCAVPAGIVLGKGVGHRRGDDLVGRQPRKEPEGPRDLVVAGQVQHHAQQFRFLVAADSQDQLFADATTRA